MAVVVVVVVEIGICRFDFRTNLMHGRRIGRRRLDAFTRCVCRRSNEKLRRRQLKNQLVRLSCRHFTWQLHRRNKTSKNLSTKNFPQRLTFLLCLSFSLFSKWENGSKEKKQTTQRHDAPTCTAEIPAQATRGQCAFTREGGEQQVGWRANKTYTQTHK